MDGDLSFQELIQYFENRVLRTEKDTNAYLHGNAPQYPPLFVFLGKQGAEDAQPIFNNLVELWPQCRDVLRLVCIWQQDGAMCQQLLNANEHGGLQPRDISTDELLDVFDGLFAYENKFNRMTMAHVYYVINTSNMDTCEEFEEAIELIPIFKKTLDVDEFSVRDSLIVLLRSDVRKRRVARLIRSSLAAHFEEPNKKDFGSVFLLSNYRNDGVLLRTWDECYRIATLFMALSNCANESINGQLFQHCVLTATYAVVQKPTHDIGQVVLDALLRGLDKHGHTDTHALLDEANIAERLGITSGGTFSVIDNDAEVILRNVVPSEEELKHFPQRGFGEYDDITKIPFDEFDNRSMGALSVYLNQQQKQHLLVDGKQMNKWATAYAGFLRQSFSVDELIYLGDHLPTVRGYISNRRAGTEGTGVVAQAKSKLKVALSQNPKIQSMFVEQVDAEAQRARTFRLIWRSLLQSLLNVQEVTDVELKQYYEQIAQEYLDHNGYELGRSFATQSSVDELREFLERSIDKLIDSNEVFCAPFEAELMSRLDTTQQNANPFAWILAHLSGQYLKTYLQVNFALNAPVARSVFVETHSQLKEQLNTSMVGDPYFYSTGSNRCVEVLNIHAVDAGNLVQANGR